MKTPIYFKRFA